MNKRLRKKKHVDEYAEFGCQLIVRRNRSYGFDEFLDAFIDEAIEANALTCGGGGKDDFMDIIVQLGRRSQSPERRLRKVTAWLDSRADVQQYRTGPLVDLWHGDFGTLDFDSELAIHATAGDHGPRTA